MPNQPLPETRIEVAYATLAGQQWVLVTEHTALGEHLLRLTPDQAKTIAASIDAAATKAELGLHLPGNGAQPT